MADSSVSISSSEHAQAVLDRLERLRKEEKQCDFTIKSGTVEVRVHKNIISASSEYFSAMLRHDTLERQSGVVEIKEVDSECVMKCVDFIYTGRVSIKREKCGELMHAAQMLQLHNLCDRIGDFLAANLQTQSFFFTRNLARFYNCKDLGEKCDRFAAENLEHLAECDQFGELDNDELLSILRVDGAACSDEQRCKGILAWIKADLEHRKGALLEMMHNVDVSTLPLQYRRHLFENEPLVYASAEVMRYFALSMLGHAPNAESQLKAQSGVETAQIKLDDPQVEAKKVTKDNQILAQDEVKNACSCIGAQGGDGNVLIKVENPRIRSQNDKTAESKAQNVAQSEVERLTTHNDSESVKIKATSKRASSAIQRKEDAANVHIQSQNAIANAELNRENAHVSGDIVPRSNNIVLFDKCRQHLLSYDPFEAHLNTVYHLHEDMTRDKMIAVTLGQSLYVLSYRKAVFRLDRYDEDLKWTRVADRKLVYGSATTLEDCIYCIGNEKTYIENSGKAEKYEPLNDRWVAIPEKTTKSWCSTLVAAKGSIFSIGGGAQIGISLGEVEKFDPKTQTWTVARSMNRRRLAASAVELDDVIYVMGGYDGMEYLYDTECYDPETNTWTSIVPMNVQRYFSSACVLGQSIFVIGGDKSGPEDVCTIEMLDPSQNGWTVIETLVGRDVDAAVSYAFD